MYIISCWGGCDDGICDIPLYLTTKVTEYNLDTLIDDINYNGPFMISVGSAHVCVIKEDDYESEVQEEVFLYGKIHCWGSDRYGQIDVPIEFRD